MDIRILGPGDEALLAAAVELADEGPLTLEASAGGVRPDPDGVMFDFEG